MTLRSRLLIYTSLITGITVALVTWIAAATTRRTFESLDNERTAALVVQIRREFERRGEEVARRLSGIAESDRVLQIAVGLNRPDADPAPYVNEASALAGIHGLDLLDLIDNDGTIVSSAQWPAHFGYRNDWVTGQVDWNSQGFFLRKEEMPDGYALALVAVRAVSAGDRRIYLVGGYRLGREFLASLVVPAGVRVLLYRNFSPGFSPQALVAAVGEALEAEALSAMIRHIKATGAEDTRTIELPGGPVTFHALPLTGRDSSLLGALLVGSSRRELALLINRLRLIGFVAAGIGIVLGTILSYWHSSRVIGPVERLGRGARAVAAGDWGTRVDVDSKDELGDLAGAFNAMTRQLADQRDRLVQTERVAAWRELARRLAHELKNPLFPLQITIENLQRAREQAPEQFEEVFRESTSTLLTQLSNLKNIVSRFGDFARMPRPEMMSVDLNELVLETVKLFEAQFTAPGRAPIVCELRLDDNVGRLDADPEQLRRVLQNLLLNAADAMPRGGTVIVRTQRQDGAVALEVSDTGEGLTKEECERLFTPYYTTKLHGTGLGLAIVQSVVSDHGAKVSVESEPGKGTTFRIIFKSQNSNELHEHRDPS